MQINSSNHNTTKVDFCITLRRRTDVRITALVRGGVAINHTVYDSYMQNPIAISIETKSRKPDQEEAQLQIGTWLSAQFQCLRHLVVARHSSIAAAKEAWRAALEGLAFLPGVIVLQHSWHLVAATRHDPDSEPNSRQQQQQQPRVVLWRSLEMGNTQTPEGICQLVVSLRILLHWAQNTYWPWFEKWVLGQVERSR
ncbi:hypothetical protein Micbo1qcDRAFT_129387 [Microdochium bolleyi]|uniref:PD-(D/E)XK nuclease-like domain-containing protein n=1 Tax=Microdochium bolleyi TaxID=196109 RepID=A0A136II78_9PEZI|nr:hypothetical protein Micbo1qcDRAFT_129387 [Microdochium bolleyi]